MGPERVTTDRYIPPIQAAYQENNQPVTDIQGQRRTSDQFWGRNQGMTAVNNTAAQREPVQASPRQSTSGALHDFFRRLCCIANPSRQTSLAAATPEMLRMNVQADLSTLVARINKAQFPANTEKLLNFLTTKNSLTVENLELLNTNPGMNSPREAAQPANSFLRTCLTQLQGFCQYSQDENERSAARAIMDTPMGGYTFCSWASAQSEQAGTLKNSDQAEAVRQGMVTLLHAIQASGYDLTRFTAPVRQTRF